VKKAKKMNNRSLDNDFHAIHKAVFQKVDCLTCANCCKTTSPIFRDVDIRRLAKRLRLSESKFIDFYLRKDSEGDYVLKQSPCVFLGDDNYCSVYEDRPLACREYPHTDRKNMYQILDLTRKNMEVCPAVSLIMQQLVQK
jgi:Fe-S-cluster containining protein